MTQRRLQLFHDEDGSELKGVDERNEKVRSKYDTATAAALPETETAATMRNELMNTLSVIRARFKRKILGRLSLSGYSR